MIMIRRKADLASQQKFRGNVGLWTKKLIDVPCFILGNGPSISNEPVKRLNDYFTIGINKAYKLIDPSILMWQDIEFWYTDRKDIAKMKCLKYCRNISDPQGKFFTFKLQGGNFQMPNNTNILHGMGATGPLAFQLACVLGCNPIILLGMDCKYQGTKTNFYGKNPFHKPHTLKMCNKGLQWIKNFENEKTIINCSDNSVFEDTYTLEEALAEINPTKISRENIYNKLFERKNI